MADKKISELTAITGSNTAATDVFVVVDTSTGQTKKITREELNNAIEQDVLSSIDIDTINGDFSVNGNINLGDNNKAIFGAGSDLQIYHDGSHSYIEDAGSGDLLLRGNNLRLQSASGENYLYALSNGTTMLYNNNAQKLATTSTGIDVTGTVTATSISVGDSHTIGNDGFDNLEITSSTSENIVLKPAGSVYLYNAGAAKLTTTSTGIDITGNATFDDDAKAIFGAGSDLQIFHQSSNGNSIIKEQGGGILSLQSNGSEISFYDTANSSNMARFVTGGAVQLYHNGSSKFSTTASGANVNGTVTADGLDISVSATNAVKIVGNGNDTLYSYHDGGGTGWSTGANGSYTNLIYFKLAENQLRFYLNSAERVRFEPDGDIHADGNVIAYSTTISDKRLKKDIQPIEDAIWRVKQLNGCTFTYLKDDRKSAGLIAQDVEKVLPSAVIDTTTVFHGEEGETYKTLQYDQVVGLLVEAVKELTARVEELENASSE